VRDNGSQGLNTKFAAATRRTIIRTTRTGAINAAIYSRAIIATTYSRTIVAATRFKVIIAATCFKVIANNRAIITAIVRKT